jgi:hypothetical protein
MWMARWMSRATRILLVSQRPRGWRPDHPVTCSGNRCTLPTCDSGQYKRNLAQRALAESIGAIRNLGSCRGSEYRSNQVSAIPNARLNARATSARQHAEGTKQKEEEANADLPQTSA